MKLLAILIFTFISAAALAQQGRPQPPPGSIPGHDQIPPRPPGGWPGDRPGDPWGPGHGGGGGHGRGTSCAPEVLEGNVKATQRVLAEVSATPSFADAQQFKSVVNEIASLRGDEARVARYFALIGVDSRDANAVAEFIGAREVRGQWLSALEKSTGVSSAQADIVATKLQTTLRGDLR